MIQLLIYHNPNENTSVCYSFTLSLYQISSQSFGAITVSIKVSSCWVSSMPEVRDMPFKEEVCYIKDCPKRLSFSFEMLQNLPSSSWDLECAVKLCFENGKVCRGLFPESVKTRILTMSILHNHLLLFSFLILDLYKRKTRQEELPDQAIYPKQK